MINNLQTIYPVSPLLKKHIYCYYIIENTPVTFKSLHYSFPHTYNAISIYNNGTFSQKSHHIQIVGNNNHTPFSILQGKCLKPLLVDLEGRFSRITILFKPLGLNNFIKVPLCTIMGCETALFTQWDSPSFNLFLKGLYVEEDINLRIASFEKFLLSIYEPVELPLLVKSLDYLADFDQEKSVKEIAELLDIPLRTFNRVFKENLGVSPSIHRQIARFRHSLENKLFDDPFKNLTEIGYKSNFYDQSYFNKLYKQLSGLNPKTFFRVVEKVNNSKLVFHYIKEQTG